MNTSAKNKLFEKVEDYIALKYYEPVIEEMKERPFDDFTGLSAPSVAKTYGYKMLETSHPEPRKSGRRIEELVNNLSESFSSMVLRLIDEKGLKDSAVYKKAGIDRRVFSRLRKNDYQPSKNTAILLAMALNLSLDEAKDLLEKAGYSLSHSNKADVIVMYFLEEGNHDIYALNETLDHFEERTLS